MIMLLEGRHFFCLQKTVTFLLMIYYTIFHLMNFIQNIPCEFINVMMDLKGLEEFRMEQDNFCLQL